MRARAFASVGARVPVRVCADECVFWSPAPAGVEGGLSPGSAKRWEKGAEKVVRATSLAWAGPIRFPRFTIWAYGN